MNDTTLGIIAAAVPLIVIGFFALRRLPWIFAFFVALVAVGIGYLQTTGAMKDFGQQVRANLPAGLIPAHKTAEEAAPAEGGAMKALPPAESTPPATPSAAPEATPPAPAAPAAESTPASPPASDSSAPAAPAAPATPAPENKPETPAAPATPAPANP